MNERIRSLAEQARLSAALLLHHWGKVDALTDSEQEALEQIEKFAVLIVRECADIAKHHVMNISTYADADFVDAQIKKHFGVEE